MEYKRAFLRANNCKVRAFERAYIRFMERNPTTTEYCEFAKKWGITIHQGMGDKDYEAALSVIIASIKVLARTEHEATVNIMEIRKAIK